MESTQVSGFVRDALSNGLGSVLGGIATVLFGLWLYRRQHMLTMKLDLFGDLMGSRYDVTNETFIKSLNKIFVLFHDDPKVVTAARGLLQTAVRGGDINKELVNLFRSLCIHCKIDDSQMTDLDFTTVLQPKDKQIPKISAINSPS